MKLGDKIKVSYDIAAGSKVEQEIQVGRPSTENNNDATPWKHDIREVKVRFTVFNMSESDGTPSLPMPDVIRRIEQANTAFAQSGIVVKNTTPADHYSVTPPKEFNEEVIDPNVSSGVNYFKHIQLQPLESTLVSSDHKALQPFLSDDANTINVFIVKRIGYQSHDVQIDPSSPPIPGEFYHANALSVTASVGQEGRKNYIVINATQLQLSSGFPFRLPHEIMHIVLNSGHRAKQRVQLSPAQHPPPLDPTTALFYITTSATNEVDSTKRIGPYPGAEATVGNNDTNIIRKNAEELPQ